MPGASLGLDGDVLILYCVLVFGWTGSPGEYMVFAWGVKWAHAGLRPPTPTTNDTVAFASKWLMDDGVILEPLVGTRPWLSMAVLEDCMRQMWGPEAINED